MKTMTLVSFLFLSLFSTSLSAFAADPLEVNVDALSCRRERISLPCQDWDKSIKQVFSKRTKDGKCYYIDSHNKPYNDKKYDVCYNQFRNGAAFVCLKDGEKRCGLAKLDGEYLVPPIYEDIRIPNEGMIAFKKDGLWGFMTLQAEVIVPPKYNSVSDFNEGLAQVKQRNKQYQTSISYINKSGQVAFSVPQGISSVTFYQEGLMAYRAGDKWGYLNKQGKIAIAPQYTLAKAFSEGYAPVRLNKTDAGLHRWGLINKNNELVHIYSGEVADVSNYHRGAALVSFACDTQKNEYGTWDCSMGCVNLDGNLTSPNCGTLSTNSLPFR